MSKLDNIITNHSFQAIALDDSDTTAEIDGSAKDEVKDLFTDIVRSVKMPPGVRTYLRKKVEAL